MAKLGDTIDFAKYEGLGNDFILIDDRDKSDPSLTPEQSERLCNRNFGIGGDGVIFALKAPEGKTTLTNQYSEPVHTSSNLTLSSNVNIHLSHHNKQSTQYTTI